MPWAWKYFCIWFLSFAGLTWQEKRCRDVKMIAFTLWLMNNISHGNILARRILKFPVTQAPWKLWPELQFLCEKNIRALAIILIERQKIDIYKNRMLKDWMSCSKTNWALLNELTHFSAIFFFQCTQHKWHVPKICWYLCFKLFVWRFFFILSNFFQHWIRFFIIETKICT